MSTNHLTCPGCDVYGQPHLNGCLKNIFINPVMDMTKNTSHGLLNESIKLPPIVHDGEPTPFISGTQVGRAPLPNSDPIEQIIVPSSGTKLVCTHCGDQNWHTLILRRKAGLIEGLCKQADGSGCYPNASRHNCTYTYPNQIDCPQVAEYIVAVGKERLNQRQVCRDHVGEMLRQGPLYQIWPLED